MKSYLALKHLLDRMGALVLLALLSPVLLLTAGAVRVILGSPVLFRQVRPGRHGEPFTLLKFRTMTDRRDADGELLPDGKRLGRFGRLLRRWSLDELPQLVNVLRGELSFVGPRPLLLEYLPLYTPEQARRHEVRPGITGLAQVEGRNEQTWEDRLRLDVEYVDRRSLWLDSKILLRTLECVCTGRGITQEGRATRERFEGDGDRSRGTEGRTE